MERGEASFEMVTVAAAAGKMAVTAPPQPIAPYSLQRQLLSVCAKKTLIARSVFRTVLPCSGDVPLVFVGVPLFLVRTRNVFYCGSANLITHYGKLVPVQRVETISVL